MSRPVYSIPRAERDSALNSHNGEPALYNPLQSLTKPNLPMFSFSKTSKLKYQPLSGPGPETYCSIGKVSRCAPAYTFSRKSPENNKENAPGPGKYSPPTNFNKNSLAFSVPKQKKGVEEKSNVPGPGAYQPLQIFSKPVPPTFSFPKELRENEKKSEMPGPGAYSPKNFDHLPGGKLGLETRKENLKTEPGPGAYDPYSSSCILRTNPAFGLKSAARPVSAVTPESGVPGPGNYQPSLDFSRARPASVKFGIQKRDKEATAIGEKAVPGPGTYNPVPTIHSAPRPVFGGAKTSAFSGPMANGVPGPGTYTATSNIPAKMYSFPKSSTLAGLELKVGSVVVGPGSYNPDFSNRRPPGIVFGSEMRAKERSSEKQVPGPGNYEPKLVGTRAASAWGFGKEKKQLPFDRSASPGPGTYESPSVFNQREAMVRGPMLRSRPQSAAPDRLPGPGAYNASLQNSRPNSPLVNFPKNPRFREKEDPSIGPGQYNSAIIGRNPGNIKFGSDSRFAKDRTEKVPGPGSYNSEKLKNSIAFSMRPKTGGEKPSEVPGPGAYEPIKSVRLALGKFDHSERASKKGDEKVLGPGAYDPKLGQTYPKWSFGKQNRGEKTQSAVPGPGMYEKIGFVEDHPSYVKSGMVARG